VRNLQDVAQQPLQDYAMTSLSFGGRYTSLTGGTSLTGVAVTGGTVMSQVDFTSTGPNGAASVSWYINGYQVFTQVQVTLPDTFFIGVAASSGGSMENAALVVSEECRF